MRYCNEITNSGVLVGDMKVVFNDNFIAQHGNLMLHTDPQETEMHKDVIEQIMKIAPAKVVYEVATRLPHKL
jgi:23S rRNA (uracil1939-C5)-methyltransferase